MMQLDRNRPYGVISGKVENNARFVQDGVEYLNNGLPVDMDAAIAKLKENSQRKVDEAMAEAKRVADEAELIAAQAEKGLADAVNNGIGTSKVSAEEKRIRGLSLQSIKNEVAAAGGEYTTKPAGIDFLIALASQS